MRRAWWAVVAALLLLVGCGDPGPKLESGTVTSKRHTPGWVEHHPSRTDLVPVTGIGFDGKVSTRMEYRYVPARDEWHPDRWELRVAGELDGERVVEWVRVDEATYLEAKEGSTWVR